MFALLLLVALCAIVAIVISAVTLSRPSTVPTITLNGLGGGQSPPVVVSGGGSGGGGGQSASDKVYSIAIGHDWGAHQYLDEKNFLRGFSKDLILEVCEHAGIDCRIVWDSYSNCWKSVPGDHSVGGVGFVNGFAADEKCIARQDKIEGNLLPQYKMKYFDLTKDAGAALHNGSVDAVFAGASVLSDYRLNNPNNDFIRINSTIFACAIHGPSIMTRKDNTLIPFWNRGFQKMKESGRFQQLCAEAVDKHGHKGVLLPCAI